MSVPELKMDHLKMIPEFSGEVPLLPDFLTVAESLVNYFQDTANPNSFQNFFLLNSIKNKIKGEAKLNLSSHSIQTWNDLKTALLETYSDKRDCYTLTIELCNMKQYGNETAFAFHTRIQSHINLHGSYIATHNDVTGKADVNKYVEKLGLRTFLKGLREPLGSLMRTKDPKSLNEALSVLTNDFQIDANANATSSGVNKSNHHSQNKQFNSNSNPNRYVPPVFRNQFSGNNQTNKNSNYQPNRFTNHQNKPSNNQWNSNNFQQNSGPSKQNVWNKPTGQFPKPTPMSAQTIRNNQNMHNIESEELVSEEYEQEPEETFPDENETEEDFCLNASENQH